MDIVAEIQDFQSRHLRALADVNTFHTTASASPSCVADDVLAARIICAVIDDDASLLRELLKAALRRGGRSASVSFASVPYNLLHYAAIAPSAAPMEALFFDESALTGLLPLDVGATCGLRGDKANAECTPLHLAALLGKESTAKVLLMFGASARAIRYKSVTVLHDALRCLTSQVDVAKHEQLQRSLVATALPRTGSLWGSRAALPRQQSGIRWVGDGAPPRDQPPGALRRTPFGSTTDLLLPVQSWREQGDAALGMVETSSSLSVATASPLDAGRLRAEILAMGVAVVAAFNLCVLLCRAGADPCLSSTPQCVLDANAINILTAVCDAVSKKIRDGRSADGGSTGLNFQQRRLYDAAAPSHELCIARLIDQRCRNQHCARVDKIREFRNRPLPPASSPEDDELSGGDGGRDISDHSDDDPALSCQRCRRRSRNVAKTLFQIRLHASHANPKQKIVVGMHVKVQENSAALAAILNAIKSQKGKAARAAAALASTGAVYSSVLPPLAPGIEFTTLSPTPTASGANFPATSVTPHPDPSATSGRGGVDASEASSRSLPALRRGPSTLGLTAPDRSSSSLSGGPRSALSNLTLFFGGRLQRRTGGGFFATLDVAAPGLAGGQRAAPHARSLKQRVQAIAQLVPFIHAPGGSQPTLEPGHEEPQPQQRRQRLPLRRAGHERDTQSTSPNLDTVERLTNVDESDGDAQVHALASPATRKAHTVVTGRSGLFAASLSVGRASVVCGIVRFVGVVPVVSMTRRYRRMFQLFASVVSPNAKGSDSDEGEVDEGSTALEAASKPSLTPRSAVTGQPSVSTEALSPLAAPDNVRGVALVGIEVPSCWGQCDGVCPYNNIRYFETAPACALFVPAADVEVVSGESDVAIVAHRLRRDAVGRANEASRVARAKAVHDAACSSGANQARSPTKEMLSYLRQLEKQRRAEN